MVTEAPLPQEIVSVTPEMQALTERYLVPNLAALMQSLQHLRKQADIDLKPQMPQQYGKPYPIGRCEQISRHVLQMLPNVLRARADAGMAALHDFIMAGGELRSIWGVLRGRYFQNAFQAGALYIDVANDTVVPSKPQIEILPLAESGMASITSAAHFAEIAEIYWEGRIYANHVVPGLAPILPMLSVVPGQPPRLQSACDYMIGLFMRDGFRDAEAWLAAQPTPPEEAVQILRAATPPHLLPSRAEQGRALALAACAEARAAKHHLDTDWRNARVLDFVALNDKLPAA